MDKIEKLKEEADQLVASGKHWQQYVMIVQEENDFYLSWRAQERYAYSLLPVGAIVLWHGRKEYGQGGAPSLVWEKATQNHSTEAESLLSSKIGADAAKWLFDSVEPKRDD